MSKTAQRTDPQLWETVKSDITKSDKGGRAGEWSARKAQLAVQEYKKRGGGYKGRKSQDNSLVQWTREDWGAKSGGESGKTGERYLPKKAREALTAKDYRATTAKKRHDTKQGKQFSSQPERIAARTARYRSVGGSCERGGEPTKAELMDRANTLGIPGRGSMDKAELKDAIRLARH